MFSAERHIARPLALVLAGCLAASAAQAGVIVKASGPSAARYPVGKKIADTDTITLREGDSVTVLTDAGTRVIRGPGTHRVGARGASKATAFAMLTRQEAGAQVRTGAVRDPNTGVARNPNIWNVDLSKPGKVCLLPGATYNMWRPDPTGEATYILKAVQSDFHIHVTFADGDATTAVPAEKLPLAQGGAYALTGPAGGTSQPVDFVLLGAAPGDAESLAATLAEHGCQGQLDLMAEALAQ